MSEMKKLFDKLEEMGGTMINAEQYFYHFTDEQLAAFKQVKQLIDDLLVFDYDFSAWIEDIFEPIAEAESKEARADAEAGYQFDKAYGGFHD